MNSPTSAWLAGADRLRQGRVGDVADQHVLERVLALAGEPAAGGRDDQVLARAATRASRPGRSPARPRRRPTPPRRSGRPPRPPGGRGARSAGSESRRAASTECTVSGSATSAAEPSSAIRLTISSANSGLPPERSATCEREVAVAGLGPSSAPTSARACSGASGSSAIRGRVGQPADPSRGGGRGARRGPCRRSAPGRAPSGPGARSGRACPRRPSGCPRRRRAAAGGRWRPRSACRRPRTGARASAAASSASPPGCPLPPGGSIPSGRPSAAASRSAGSEDELPELSASTPRQSLRQAVPASSVSRISKVPRTISASAQ